MTEKPTNRRKRSKRYNEPSKTESPPTEAHNAAKGQPGDEVYLDDYFLANDNKTYILPLRRADNRLSIVKRYRGRRAKVIFDDVSELTENDLKYLLYLLSLDETLSWEYCWSRIQDKRAEIELEGAIKAAQAEIAQLPNFLTGAEYTKMENLNAKIKGYRARIAAIKAKYEP